MIEAVFGGLRQLVTNWTDEAKSRREISTVDPIADDTAYRAKQLAEVLDSLEGATKMLTPAEYATLHRTTSQTVTAWCRAGKIKATPNGKSYLIPASTIPPRSRSTRGRRRTNRV